MDCELDTVELMNTSFLTTAQVGRVLGLSAERVRQLAKSGSLPPSQETPLGRLWDPVDVAEFAASRQLDGEGAGR